MTCPEPERLQALVDGGLAEDDRAALAAHADECEACRAAVVDLFQRRAAVDAMSETAVSDPASAETVHSEPVPVAITGDTGPGRAGAGSLAPGTAVDRYVIERRLGAGAMGVVYAARDPQLDRQVAIKLLRGRDDDEGLRARLLREAQALARVDHANVVAVHDVGPYDGQVFVAMELVRGDTLRAWLAKPRAWRDVLAVVVAAGRGLAAAHAAGLVHRDFKPDNVLVGDDGVARVTDFGLARATGLPADDDGRAGSDPAATTGTPLDSTLTATGSLLGTPVYAAPEQLAGDRAGPLADQFSFCVTAYEACYGHRPFRALALGELLENIETHTIEPPPPGRRIPGRIYRALVRGLAPRPQDRFPSMTALLAALAPRPRRWPWIAAAVAAVAVPIAIAVAVSGGHAAARCRSADDRLAGIWDGARRAKVLAAFTGLDGYAEAGPKVVAQLDGYAGRWRAGWQDACTATEQSSTMFDLRIGCLEQLRSELAAAAATLGGADRVVASKAIELLEGLSGVDRCADATALAAVPPPLPAQREAIAKIDAELATGLAFAKVDNYPAAHESIDPAVAQARVVGYPHALVRALLGVGSVENLENRLGEAEAAIREASSLAISINDRRLTASTLLELAKVRSSQGDIEGAGDTLDLAGGAIKAMGSGAGSLETDFLVAMAVLRSIQTRPADAVSYLDQAITRIEADPAPDPLDLARTLAARGQMLDHLGRHAEAAVSLDRSLAIITEVAGQSHPRTAMVLALVAGNRAAEKHYAEAMEMIQRAYDTLSRTLGPESSTTAEAEDGLAAIALELGDFPAALAHYQHILEVSNRADPRSNQALTTRVSIADTQNRMGKPDEAIATATALREDIAHVLGAESPLISLADLSIADARLAQGKLADAIALYGRCDQALVAAFGEGVSLRARSRGGRGRALLAQGHAAEALVELNAAREFLAEEGEPYLLAELELAIADALWRTGDRAGAQEAATAAIAALDALSPGASPRLRAAIATWRAAHPSPTRSLEP